MGSASAASARHRVVILGAGRSVSGSAPSAMVPIGERQRVLDWLLASFAVLDAPQVHFVGGYRAGDVAEQYPDIRFAFNPDWETTGPARSLALVPLTADADTFVSYSDVLCRPETVSRLAAVDDDIVLAIDSQWRVRYDGRGTAEMESAEKLIWSDGRLADIGKHVPLGAATAEFAGLMKLRGDVAARLRGALRTDRFRGGDGVPEIIRHLASEGASVSAVDVNGDWAELNAPQDIARFVLRTKAESLERLKPLVSKGRIADLFSFTRQEWQADPDATLRHVQQAFGETSLIIRSSAMSEDTWASSGAGAYLSVLRIPASDEAELAAAIRDVISSYGEAHPEDRVLVQEMLEDVSMSGVVMTRTSTSGAPYYVFNFDSSSARTDTVTSGQGRALRTFYQHRDAPLRRDAPEELRELLPAIQEIEHLVGHDSLDIEFAFVAGQPCTILQVRPIAVGQREEPVDDAAVSAGIERAVRYHRELQKPLPFLAGSRTVFSVMSDWNPAEMIGAVPNRLAFSLYRHLITDETWALQRAESGYRDVRPNNLIVDLLGHPYVDLRVDFNSFVPADLPDEFAGRLVDHYVDELIRRPELHDKVEFDVLFTCFDFDIDRRLSRLRDAGFAAEEVAALRASLLAITRHGIARVGHDLARIEELERRFDAIAAADLDPLERAFAALDDARRIGIPAFAHLARNAFAAVALLRSLTSAGVIRAEDEEGFLASVRTVPSAMQADARRVDRGELAWDELVRTYGHLRPGSYDIISPCYASAPMEFLGPMLDGPARDRDAPVADPWPEAARASVAAALAGSGLAVAVDEFERFLRQAIEGREFAKFAFTRNLGAALEAIADFGAAHGLSREDLAHVRIGELLALRGAHPGEVSSTLRGLVRRGRDEAAVAQAVLPAGAAAVRGRLHRLRAARGRRQFHQWALGPGRRRMPLGSISPSLDLAGKIVLVADADPGYDWLFARGIAGLITMYGGVNSHMAIRAAEFELPAAIGVGELRFERLRQARRIDLDCASRQILVMG